MPFLTPAIRSISVFLFLLCLIPRLSADEAANPENRSFIWEVKSETATAYLLGSIHFANAQFYPLSKNIEAAFERSSALVVEINPLIIDDNAMARIVMDRGVYKGNETIADHISEDTLALLKNYTTKNNIPFTNIAKLKPAMLGLTLTTAQLTELGFTPEQGIDVYFCRKAKQNMEIIELETMEQQLSLFFDMPEQDLFLKYTLLDLDRTDELFAEMIASWKTGDHQGMTDILLTQYEKHSELEPIFDTLFYKRNIKMAKKITELLTGKETVFVVVGAGHLVGDKGIIQLLRKRSYAVQQL